VASPAEAVRALCANFPDFEQHLVGSERRGVGYNVWSGGHNLAERELAFVGAGRIYISPPSWAARREDSSRRSSGQC